MSLMSTLGGCFLLLRKEKWADLGAVDVVGAVGIGKQGWGTEAMKKRFFGSRLHQQRDVCRWRPFNTVSKQCGRTLCALLARVPN